MGSKLGLHIIEPYRIRNYDQSIINSKPRVIKVVGGPTEFGILPYFSSQIGTKNTIYIARVFPYEKAVSDAYASGKSPQQAADIMLKALGGFVKPSGLDFVYFEAGMNEPADASLSWQNQYYRYIVPHLKTAGIKSVCFNFSVCHPALAAWTKLSDALSSIKDAGPEWALVGLHQYGLMENMQDYAEAGEDSRVLRHRAIPELRGYKIVITECGLDSPGWKKTDQGPEGYMADLQWLDYELRKDTNIAGIAIYTMDGAPGWEDFRLDGNMATRLFNYLVIQNASIIEVPPEPEPPPPDPPAPDPDPAIVSVVVQAPGCNMRSEAKKASTLLGYAAPGSEFEVKYPVVAGYVEIPSLGCWIFETNLERI